MVAPSGPGAGSFERGESAWDVEPPTKKSVLDRLRKHYRKFRYSHLKHENNEIRLLRLHPGENSESISGEIQHFSMRSCPAYKAVSYTWGEQIPALSTVIQLNKGDIAVGPNLASFLHEARRDILDWGWLWIDALCINQENIRERSRQVLSMKEIYEGAETVIVWLGLSDGNSETACDMVKYFAGVVREQRKHGSTSFSAPTNPAVYGTSERMFIFKDWNALKSILFRPWWERAWIIQEATSPTRLPPIVWCGSQRLNLTDFDDANYCAYKAGRNWEFLQGNEVFPVHNPKVFGIANTLAARQRKDKDAVALLELLRMVRTFKSTDPRDKVFAILAIAPEVGMGGFQPDYSQATAAIYTNLATLLIGRGELDVLGFCGVKRSIPELPSWVPDWTTEVGLFLFPKRQWHPGNVYSRVYNASGDSVPDVRFSKDGRILFALGFIFDTVQGISPTRTPKSNLPIETWAGIALDIEPRYPGGGTKLEAFQQALCADVRALETRNAVRRLPNLVQLPESLLAKPSSIFFQSSLTRHIPQYAKISSAVKGELDFAAEHTMPGAWPEQVLEESSSFLFQSSVIVDQLTSYRKMIKTMKGYVGLASSETLPGDKICILSGGQLPFMLREEDGHYLLMGECYIHGIMDGKAVDAFELASESTGAVRRHLEIW